MNTAPAPAPAPAPRRLSLSHAVRPLAWAGLAVVLSGCVIAPRPFHHAPRVRVWVPFPIWFVPVSGYRHSEGSYDRDRYECYRVAVRETGIDPGGMTPISERGGGAPTPAGAEVAAGAAVGAVAGGVVSSPRNAGAGMVIGALLGAAVGAAAHEARDARERAERAEREAREARARRGPDDDLTREEQQLFRRAMSECMERRGYRPR